MNDAKHPFLGRAGILKYITFNLFLVLEIMVITEVAFFKIF